MRLVDILSEKETIALADLLDREPPRVHGREVVDDESEEDRLRFIAAMYGNEDATENARVELDQARALAARARAELDFAKAASIKCAG